MGHNAALSVSSVGMGIIRSMTDMEKEFNCLVSCRIRERRVGENEELALLVELSERLSR
jgi:hypothetical protein